jgi:hypothetical protein
LLSDMAPTHDSQSSFVKSLSAQNAVRHDTRTHAHVEREVPSHVERHAVGVHLLHVVVELGIDDRLREDVEPHELLVRDVVLLCVCVVCVSCVCRVCVCVCVQRKAMSLLKSDSLFSSSPEMHRCTLRDQLSAMSYSSL